MLEAGWDFAPRKISPIQLATLSPRCSILPAVPSSTATSLSLSEVERLSLERTAAEEPILTTDLPPFIQVFKDIGTTSAADRSPRTLVLCFDGTGDQFNTNNSNIIQFFQLLAKGNRAEQMVYYQAGIGTYTIPQIATPYMAKLEKRLDEMFAWNLNAHVVGGYEFLMQNYEIGDKICVFGFSRGAYTARALAGMVHKVGLIPTCNHQQVPFAYKMFTRTDKLGWKQSAFKKAFSIDVDIEFVGVWDTVSSVGLIPRTLPFTASNTSIKTFRHAISLDERRAKFKANLFNKPQKFEASLGTQPRDMSKSQDPDDSLMGPSMKGTDDGNDNGKQIQSRSEFGRYHHEPCNTDAYEVWFAGCHCDVGGGSVPTDTPHSLARIPLRWMIRQCFLASTGIRFHTHLLRDVGLNPRTLYPRVLPRPQPVSSSPNVVVPPAPTSPSWSSSGDQRGPQMLTNYTSAQPGQLTEEEEDLADALSPMYDQLDLAWYWWILEVMPMRHKVQQADNRWVNEYYLNLGRPRDVSAAHKKEKLHVHRSVKLREEAENLPGGSYRHRLEFFTEPTWVD